MSPTKQVLLGSLYTIIAAIVIGAGFALLLPDIHWGKQKQLCTKEVDILLHSKDLVEVVRAGFIVLRMECSISTRLTDEDLQETGVKQ